MPAERPIHGMLTQASGRLSGHMPGHKGRAPFGAEDPYLLDTTELPVTDDLYAPEGAIARAEALYAETAGSGKTLFLTGGASAGITVMLLLWARHGCAGRPGDVVLLPRNAHHSAVDACINFGLRPVWIPVRQRENGKIFVAEEDVLAVKRQLDAGVNCPTSTGMGRLFDAASALLGLARTASYEGQGAVLLEAAVTGEAGGKASRRNSPETMTAAKRFHDSLVLWAAETAERMTASSTATSEKYNLRQESQTAVTEPRLSGYGRKAGDQSVL